MQDQWLKRGEGGESGPSFGDLVHEARRERAGPPRDPWALAYPHVRALARDFLWREVKDKRRREAVLKEFEGRVDRIEASLAKRETLGEQRLALGQVLAEGGFEGLDLRTRRKRKGPDDAALLREHADVYARVKKAFGKRSDQSPFEVQRRLTVEFPSLEPDESAEAVSDKPSWGAYVVLGARHGLKPARMRDRLTQARRVVAGKTRRKRTKRPH